MARRNSILPKYRRHKPSGRAVVTLDGQDFYLGPWGSAGSKQEYERLISEWISQGHRIPPPEHEPIIDEVLLEYWKYAEKYYKKNGKATSELTSIKAAMRPLRRLYGKSLVKEFGPRQLKAVRDRMIELEWSRTNINAQIGRIKRVFRWRDRARSC